MNLGKFSKQIFTHIAFLIMIRNVISLVPYPGYCPQCEEEIWEEVPCSQISRTTTTTSTTSTTTSTISTTTSTTTTTTPLPTTSTTSILLINSTEDLNDYRRCYCECKVGCRDFCRKVIVNADARRQQYPYPQNTVPLPNGIIGIQNYRQRNLQGPYRNTLPVERYENSYRNQNSEEISNVYDHSKIINHLRPLPNPVQYHKFDLPSDNPINQGYPISASNLSPYTNPATVNIPYNPEPNYQSYTSDPQKKIYRKIVAPTNSPCLSPGNTGQLRNEVLSTARANKDRTVDPAFETVLDSYLKNFVYTPGSATAIKSRYPPNQLSSYAVAY